MMETNLPPTPTTPFTPTPPPSVPPVTQVPPVVPAPTPVPPPVVPQPLSPPPQDQVVVVPQKSKSMMMPLMALFAVIVLAVLAGFAYFFFLRPSNNQQSDITPQLTVQPSVEPTVVVPTAEPTVVVEEAATWKTVSNAIVSFKIPTDWHSIVCTSGTNIIVGKAPNIDSPLSTDQTIDCNSNPVAGTIMSVNRTDTVVTIPTNTDPAVDPQVSDTQTIQVGGKPATIQQEVFKKGSGVGTDFKVYMQNVTSTDVITLSDVSQKQIFDQILATFQF